MLSACVKTKVISAALVSNTMIPEFLDTYYPSEMAHNNVCLLVFEF